MITIKQAVYNRRVKAGIEKYATQNQRVKRTTIYLFWIIPVYRDYKILATNL